MVLFWIFSFLFFWLSALAEIKERFLEEILRRRKNITINSLEVLTLKMSNNEEIWLHITLKNVVLHKPCTRWDGSHPHPAGFCPLLNQGKSRQYQSPGSCINHSWFERSKGNQPLLWAWPWKLNLLYCSGFLFIKLYEVSSSNIFFFLIIV